MSKVEKGEGYSREVYDKTAEDESNLKVQIAGAKTADEMMAIAMKLKEVEGKKVELGGAAHKEALNEDQEKAKQKETGAKNSKAELADAIQEDKDTSAKKAEEVLNSLNPDREKPQSPNLKYSYSNPEEYRQSLKRLQNDEQEKIIGFVGKINDDSISSKELFDLQELMFRSQGSMDKETRDKIWEDIELIKKRRKEKYKSVVEGEKSHEDAKEAKNLLKNLFNDADSNTRGRSFNPFESGNVSEEQRESIDKLTNLFKSLDQTALAQEFFDDTIGKRIDNNKAAYMVYGLFKGTEFSSKFKELESARLKRAGFGEFTL